MLSDRALNRALLARQGLLERSDAAVADMVERLVGLQAQVPENPYVALWSRLRGFDPEQLSAAIAGRALARAQLMRSTIHLVSTRDCLALHPLTHAARAQTFKNGWLRGLKGADLDDVVAAGVALLHERPRTRAELADELAPRWPRADPPALAHAVTFLAPLVQVPPRGLWGGRGQATWAPAEQWLDAPLALEPSLDRLVLRYLAAFGPATVADLRTWSGLTGLRDTIERLRPQLRTFTDERGHELLDVPDGLLPDPDTPAPPRFLPDYDNAVLSHADRSRIVAGTRAGERVVLVDGFASATWTVDGGTLAITGIAPRDDVEKEGLALLELVAPGMSSHHVTFG